MCSPCSLSRLPLLPVSPHAFGAPYIFRLGTLVTTAQQKNNFHAIPSEVNPIVWSEMNAKFDHTVTYRGAIAQIPPSLTGASAS